MSRNWWAICLFFAAVVFFYPVIAVLAFISKRWKRDADDFVDQRNRIVGLIQSNTVWCRNGHYAPQAAWCCNVACPFKDNVPRFASASELARCRSFVITEKAADWRTAAHIYPEVRR